MTRRKCRYPAALNVGPQRAHIRTDVTTPRGRQPVVCDFKKATGFKAAHIRTKTTVEANLVATHRRSKMAVDRAHTWQYFSENRRREGSILLR